MKRWAAMSKTFARLNKDIILAIKEGGGITDPDLNARLRAVMQNCRAANMPKDNIERAIKKATDKDAADLKQVTFEGYGPHGIAVFVETATDNNNRTVANVRSYFNKCNGNLGTTGSVEFMFSHVCHFKIALADRDPEEIELELIDFGAEEIGVDEDSIMIYGAFESYGGLQKKLEEDKKSGKVSAEDVRKKEEAIKKAEEKLAELEKELEKGKKVADKEKGKQQ